MDKRIFSGGSYREAPWAVYFKGTSALVITGAALLFLCIVVFYATCTKYVKPNEMGIKQVDINLGGLLGKMGIHEEIYHAGIHRQFFGCERIHTFPKDVQVLTLKADSTSEENTPYVRFGKAANIQTSDGFQIGLDVSILYHITDPYKTLSQYGLGRNYEVNGLLQRAEPTLKSTLGIMNPEDFFNTKLRVQKQNEARNALNKEFSDKGIAVDQILIRFPHYNPVVQQKIEERNLQEQTRYMNITAAAEAEAQGRLTKVIEEGKAAMSIVLTNGANYITRKTAEMEKYDRIKRSEADKLKNLAEAEKNRLINEAYQGIGSERIVAMEMAEVLKGLDYIMVPAGGKSGFNPLDLQSLSQMLQLNQTGGKTNEYRQ